MKKFILLVACLFIIGCSTAYSYSYRNIEPIPQAEFSPIIIKDFAYSSVKPKPSIEVVPNVKKSTPKDTPKPVVPKTRQDTTHSGILASGQASWYCKSGISICTRGHPGGMYAAIRKDLLYLRGKTIMVCMVGNVYCIHVTVVDCNCGAHANLIDLYSDAYRKLAPLSTGRINVRIYK